MEEVENRVEEVGKSDISSTNEERGDVLKRVKFVGFMNIINAIIMILVTIIGLQGRQELDLRSILIISGTMLLFIAQLWSGIYLFKKNIIALYFNYAIYGLMTFGAIYYMVGQMRRSQSPAQYLVLLIYSGTFLYFLITGRESFNKSKMLE